MSDLTSFPATRPTTTAPPPTTSTTPPTNPLLCYKCSCTGSTCPCNITEVNSAGRAYCAITRIINGQTIYIDYRHIYINSTAYYVREYPYVFVRDSITYNEIYGRWNTQPQYVIFGCNTDLCNKPALLPYLPISFQMRLSESWLNSTILGNGQPVSSCYECSNGTVCSTNNFIDDSQCPPQPCNTTCLVSDKYEDPSHTEQCYDSHCAPEDDSIYTIDKYRVDIEGVIYPSDPNNVELWEIDIYCRAENCSRGEIFEELRQNLTVQTGDLTILFNQTAQLPQIRCFSCYCSSDQNCICDTVSTASVESSFCTIVRNYNGNNDSIYFNPTEINPSYTNVQEFPFVLVKESILYDNQTGQWFGRTNEVIYGCNWDYCNTLSLLSLLPSSLQISLPDSWLNSTILDTQQPLYTCYSCTDPICSLNNNYNDSSCGIRPCNTTCFASNTYVNTTIDEQCYQSYCLPEGSSDNSDNSDRIDLEIIVYASQPDVFELWKTDVYCRVDNCSRPEIFQEIKQNIFVNTSNLPLLFNQSNLGNPDELRCYECYCMNDPICACNKTVTETAGETYCTVVRLTVGQDFWIYLEPLDRNSTLIYIREFPYMLVDETILFNHGTGRWDTVPTLIVYGCNTNFCNDPRFVPRLPVSFQLRLPETWLNTSILGNGLPVRDCHECPDAPQCGTTDFLDVGRCPIRACNTTCLVKDTFDNPLTNELCYQSYCLTDDYDQDDANRHRVEIEGIIYGNVPNAQLELWEVDIYCRADDCSRPELFKELEQQLVVDLGDLSAFFNMTTIPTTTSPPVQPTLTCYECSCMNDPICECDTTVIETAGETYCTVVRLTVGQDFWIYLEPLDRNSTLIYIREFPYMLVDETILFNHGTGRWDTVPTLIVYGCNTNLCNAPRLVPSLPVSFQLRLPETWLNTSILGNGLPVRDCHECPDAPQCGTTDFLDASRCPIRACNTTCLVKDTFDNPLTNELCYQSYCLTDDYDQDDANRHRVEIEGIIYGNVPNAQLELWEVDIYCRADDCSRPELFKELEQQLVVDLGNLSAFFNMTTIPTTTSPPVEPTITCYDCFCANTPTCDCDVYSAYSTTLNYCTIIRQDIDDGTFYIFLEHIRRNSTRVFIREFPFLLAEESILYNETTQQWRTRTNLVIYGCNTNFCNHPRFVPYLPNSFQMRLDDTWLNTNVLGSGLPVRDCHECPDAAQCGTTEFLDAGRCPIRACNTTCVVSDLYSDPDTDEQCYQSFCAPPDSPFFTVDPHRVEMEGILYLQPEGRPVELWEIDILCRADDCSRPEIFNEVSLLKKKFELSK